MFRKLKAQTILFSKGYDPHLSEGSAIPPVFRTSTFVFKNSEEGKRAFEIAYGLKTPEEGEIPALIYTRVNNPNCEMVEDKVAVWDEAETAALFSSGMGAISSTCLSFLKPGDTLLFSDPVYGGTEFFFRKILPQYNINTIPFPSGSKPEYIENLVKENPRTKIIFIESPANPTIMLTDFEEASKIAKRNSKSDSRIRVIVDNTFMGPIFCHPLKHGADIIVYSATKFIGGHSDLVAGIVLGSKEDMGQIKVTRTIFGSNSDPDTAWLILRSLGTLDIRMKKQQENAKKIVEFLLTHSKVIKVAYPGLDQMGDYQKMLHRKLCKGTGSLISFMIDGGEKEAFKVMDATKEFLLAVSLGGIESLIEHPHTMTHADMNDEEKANAGITSNMIRLSVGLQDADDLVHDLGNALKGI